MSKVSRPKSLGISGYLTFPINVIAFPENIKQGGVVKSYKVLFFTSSVGNQHGQFLRHALPSLLTPGQNLPANLSTQIIDGHAFQIRDLEKSGTHVWKGVFGRLRDDAPNVVGSNGMEATLPLQPSDRLLEKCHFLYMANRDMLVWQVNQDVSSITKLSNYLGTLLNLPVFMLPVVGVNSIQRVLQGTVKNVECKIATPNSPIHNIPQYSQPMFDLMNSVNGSTVKITLSAGRGTLAGDIMRLIQWASGNPGTRMLKARIEGDEEPIDLLADRISDRISVRLVGHYPDQSEIFTELNSAFDNNRSELQQFFR